MDQATWKTSFILSLCFHIILLFGATVLPDLIKTKPNFDDIYTVDLIDLAEPAVQEPMEPSGIEEPKIIEAQPVHKEALPPKDPDVHLQAKIAEIKAAIPPVTTEKPVSIKPLKRKLVKKNTSVAANSRRKDLEQIAKQRLEEAKRAEELAQKAAQLAADRAVSQLRNELLIREKTKAADSASHKRAGERTGLTRSVVESQYFANLFSHLHPNWKLPQHRLWDNELNYDLKQQREAFISDILGKNIRRVTRHKGLVVAPRFAHGGNFMTYTSYHTGNQNLYITDLRQNKTTRVLSRRNGLNLAGDWMPDGNSFFATLSYKGNPDIYMMRANGSIAEQLTQNSGINVSPTVSPDGSSIVFVSDRFGTPQLFLLDLTTRKTQRITFTGEVKDLNYQLRVVNKKLEDMRMGTVDQMQQRQAASSNQLDSLKQELLVLRGQLDEMAHYNRQLTEQSKELDLNLQQYSSELNKNITKEQEQLQNATELFTSRITELENKVRLQAELLEQIQKERVKEARLRAEEAARFAAAARDKARTKPQVSSSSTRVVTIEADKTKITFNPTTTQKSEETKARPATKVAESAKGRLEQLREAWASFANSADKLPASIANSEETGHGRLSVCPEKAICAFKECPHAIGKWKRNLFLHRLHTAALEQLIDPGPKGNGALLSDEISLCTGCLRPPPQEISGREKMGVDPGKSGNMKNDINPFDRVEHKGSVSNIPLKAGHTSTRKILVFIPAYDRTFNAVMQEKIDQSSANKTAPT
ncbi:unnamed protein product, partial [Cyprideis torosa]